MKKTEFYEKYGHLLLITNPEDPEYGEHLILAPEEDGIATSYNEEGHKVFTVYEEAEEGGEEFVEEGLDLGTNPYKVGYFVLIKPI